MCVNLVLKKTLNLNRIDISSNHRDVASIERETNWKNNLVYQTLLSFQPRITIDLFTQINRCRARLGRNTCAFHSQTTVTLRRSCRRFTSGERAGKQTVKLCLSILYLCWRSNESGQSSRVLRAVWGSSAKIEKWVNKSVNGTVIAERYSEAKMLRKIKCTGLTWQPRAEKGSSHQKSSVRDPYIKNFYYADVHDLWFLITGFPVKSSIYRLG